MPQFLVHSGDVDHATRTASLYGEEARHLVRSLRATPGDPIILFDAEGHRWLGRAGTLTRDSVCVEFLEPLPTNEPRVALDLVQALPKGERWEWILEKGTELGVRRFLPVLTQRTVARLPPSREADRLHRWRKIARAAAKQCERALVPEIAAPRDAEATLRSLGPVPPGELRLALMERLSPEPGARPPLPVSRVVVAVGPEGGWSPEDRSVLAAAGFRPWGLGPRILRSETAAVAALAVALSWWGDLEAPPLP